jgi:DNA-binding NarL/FixJ family response regulator
MSERQRIRIMIVDDHPLFRAGLQKALELHDDLQVVGASADGDQAIRDYHSLRPEVVLLDINLPRRNGLQVAQQLRIGGGRLPYIVFLTAHHDDEQILYAFDSGASAYTTKDVHPDDLVQIIHDVTRGFFIAYRHRMTGEEFEAWFQQQRLRQMGATFTQDDEERLSALSAREMEILSYVTDGMLNKEIAHELGISQQTVKNHITSILKKLNVKDRTQAAVTALKRGWVRLNDDPNQEEQP